MSAIDWYVISDVQLRMAKQALYFATAHAARSFDCTIGERTDCIEGTTVAGEHPQTAERWPRSCLTLPVIFAIALMACVLSGALIHWRGGALPELNGQVGAYRIVAYTTVVPTCSPALPCRQQFADVPLPRYYVLWVVPHPPTREPGTRLLTLPLMLPRLR